MKSFQTRGNSTETATLQGFSICLPGCSCFFTVALIKILLCAFLQAGHNPDQREHQTLPTLPSHRGRAWAGALPRPGGRSQDPGTYSIPCSQFPICCPFFAFPSLDSSFPGRDLLPFPRARRQAPTSCPRGCSCTAEPPKHTSRP